MCGIAGIISKPNNADINISKLVNEMLELISHRGRGELGIKTGNNYSLGCYRLPVLTNGGEQPVSNELKSIFAVLNGEIYNYNELIDSLKLKHTIKGDCDTVILPHLYEEGELSLRKLSGMYALCVHDTVSNETVLMRDLIGIKPLYIFENNFFIAFASEKKAFSYLNHGKVSEVMPGELLRLKHGLITSRANIVKPWNKSLVKGNYQSVDYTGLRDEITNSLIQQLPSEWPVAVLCSGGIDSVILTYLAKKYHKHNVQAYVIGNENSADVKAARLACHHLDVNLKEIRISMEEIIKVLPEVIYHVESFESNLIRNSILSYLVFREIRKDGFRVAICGEGADELFAGYGDFRLLSSIIEKQKFMKLLLDDLFKTQLQRVDRTSMAFNVETRVPFLDDNVIEYACNIPIEKKCGKDFGRWLSKLPLRHAFANTQIPTEILLRQKETFSSGAGLGDLSMVGGPIEKIAQSRISSNEFISMQSKYPVIDIKTYEQALYLSEYLKYFFVPEDYRPPVVATVELSCLSGFETEK
ncbi:asparagine synthetase B family protein [Methylovulum miyakonense]|uniref:asparagine synthetase B family protein n=1 Tax=Methylovulum miyakonense TaxID=645578 RepID=UPI0003A8A0C3|nr:asparagine synthase-related protein [Methylovulum miyakonense]